jgi:hypothetical protein
VVSRGTANDRSETTNSMTIQSSQLPFLLLHELNYRINNVFSSAISIVSLAIARSISKAVTSDNGSAPINFHPGREPRIVNKLAKALWWAIRAKVRNPWLGVRCDIHHQEALGAIGTEPTCRRQDLTADNRHNRREDVCARGKMFVGRTGP